MSIKTRAMCVSLTISVWLAKRLDKKESDAVAEQHKADKDAVEVAKRLVPKTSLDGVKAAESSARNKLYELTLPWGEKGVRILSVDIMKQFDEAMIAEERNFNAKVAQFLAKYPEYLESAPARMNGLFRAKDFPTLEQMRHKFGFRLDVMPIADAADFRVDLDADQLALKVAQVERTMTNRFQEAQREIWGRLFEELRLFADAMKDDTKIFRDTKLSNLAEIAELAPKLSLAPDPELQATCDALIKLVRAHDPETLRRNKAVRGTAATQAQSQLAKMERLMRGVAA